MYSQRVIRQSHPRVSLVSLDASPPRMEQLQLSAALFVQEPIPTAPNPCLALSPLLALALTLLWSLLSPRLGFAPTSDDKVPPRPLLEPEDAQDDEDGPAAVRSLHLTRAVLVACSVLVSAALLAVSLGRIVGGDGEAWEIVFDVGCGTVSVSPSIRTGRETSGADDRLRGRRFSWPSHRCLAQSRGTPRAYLSCSGSRCRRRSGSRSGW